MNKKIFAVLALILTSVLLIGCKDDAKVASHNLSKAADNFEIERRIVFYNGITGEYMLTIEGRCSIRDQKVQLEVTCQVSENEYKKHFLGLSDNVTYFAEQLSLADVNLFHHRITFKPQSILPDVDFRGSAAELIENSSENSSEDSSEDSSENLAQ